ncbi:hypothetical protein ACROYT_G024438 [Oculina patagonica]
MRYSSGITSLDNETYDVFLQLIKGEFDVPVKDRTTKQKSAVVRFWRNREKLSLRGGQLFYNRRAVVKKAELQNVVKVMYKRSKGSGTRKLYHRIKDSYSGVAERDVHKMLSKSCTHQRLNVRFENKARLRPVPAKGVQIRHQIDLVNMQRLRTKFKGKVFNTLSRNANIDAEINNRISKACSVFGRLREKVWERRGISLNTKLKVYRAVVLTTLLYGCETWTAYRRHEKLINHFHLRCLRNILHIRWQDKVPDTEVLKQADLSSAITIMRKAQLRWAGHVSRMPDDRIPKQLFYGELCSGKRTVGGQRKRYKDSLKVSLKDFNISTESWESLASDRPSWRQCITKGAQAAEKRRSRQAEEKRTARKGRAVSTNSTAPTHFCSTCGRGFLAQIGLISHLRTHQRI